MWSAPTCDRAAVRAGRRGATTTDGRPGLPHRPGDENRPKPILARETDARQDASQIDRHVGGDVARSATPT